MRDDPNRSTSQEWLVTNGLGGYAMGTVGGVATRSYHGFLIVARKPPVDRSVIVAGLTERVRRLGGEYIDLSIEAYLRGWRLDGRHPVFTYSIDGLTVEKRVWMAHGEHTTYVRYELVDGTDALELEVTPMVTKRDHHAVRNHRPDDPPPLDLRILLDGDAVPVRPNGVVRTWLREETARGLLDATDALTIAPISARLVPGVAVTLTLTVEPDEPLDGISALAQTHRQDARLLAAAGAGSASSFVQRLVLGADAFVVRRDIDGVPDGRTVIAGYPWFNDWGRDTMIALPGLCLATGRHAEARSILRAFARFVRDGLIPNDFPDDPNVEPAYHTIDATLWFAQAVRAYVATVKVTDDDAFLAELLPTIRTILDAHIIGTRFGIGMDPADGLLRGGADGVQLTWMDAKVDDWVVTPRRGKPVEIQALWINALREFATWSREASYAAIADAATTSFHARFWRPELGYLADVVDRPDGDDISLRPNQLLALSLPHPLVDVPIARSVLRVVGRELAVPLGLRSLAPSDPAYRPEFQGDRRFRDSGYHQGTVWTWLIGPYADAVARFGGGPAAALAVLEPFHAHLAQAGLGSVSEILEPEPPFAPRGCPFQAWGVAEVLRAWRAYGGT
ncbi:MAG: amylo-alpha-1,6-glucosidase [Candidatus Limnocylindrales bacterium]